MWLALPPAYLVVALLLHALAVRMRPAGNRVHLFLVLGSLTGVALIGHLAANTSLALPAQAAAVLLYAFGCELYVFLFTFVTSSVSVALLVSPGPGQPAASPDEMVRRRLAAMHAAGLLQTVAAGYVLTPRARQLVRVYRGLRAFFRHRTAP